jgi:hypothetical protein
LRKWFVCIDFDSVGNSDDDDDGKKTGFAGVQQQQRRRQTQMQLKSQQSKTRLGLAGFGLV